MKKLVLASLALISVASAAANTVIFRLGDGFTQDTKMQSVVKELEAELKRRAEHIELLVARLRDLESKLQNFDATKHGKREDLIKEYTHAKSDYEFEMKAAQEIAERSQQGLQMSYMAMLREEIAHLAGKNGWTRVDGISADGVVINLYTADELNATEVIIEGMNAKHAEAARKQKAEEAAAAAPDAKKQKTK